MKTISKLQTQPAATPKLSLETPHITVSLCIEKLSKKKKIVLSPKPSVSQLPCHIALIQSLSKVVVT
jgi:hypothetical protein